MTYSIFQRWLLSSLAVLAIMASLAFWWTASSRDPMPASQLTGSISHEERAAPTQARIWPHAADSNDRAEPGEFQSDAAALTAQGYPARTVRELVASRITAAFQARRIAIRSLARQDHGNAADLQSQLDALNRQQGALITQVAGTEEQPAADATAQTSITQTLRPGNEKQILMPAVMAEAMPASVKSGEQAADWEKLRNNFVAAIGGANQDPASPQYRTRWAQAESASDARFKLLYGDIAFVEHQMHAQREAAMKAAQAPTTQ